MGSGEGAGVARGGADVQASVMLRTPTFWALWVAYCLGTTAGTMVISQLVPFARNSGHSAAFAAFALTVGAFGSASGRVLSGWMSDYAGRLNTLRVMLLISACAMPLLFLLRENVVLFYALLAVANATATARSCRSTPRRAPISPGTKNVGFNLRAPAPRVGSGGHPRSVSRPRDSVYVATGEYRWAFFAAAAMSIVALATLFLARNPHAHAAPAVAV